MRLIAIYRGVAPLAAWESWRAVISTRKRASPPTGSRSAVQIGDYLKNLPLLHTWDEGKTWNTGGFTEEHLQKLLDFLGKELPERPALLETGAGNSTIAMLLLQPGRLTSICPEQALFERIRSYCDQHGIDTRSWSTYVEGSEWALPKLADLSRAAGPVLDFALIDGCHNWPMVFVDFCYVDYLLRRGGYLMIDDLNLHSVKELGRLLQEGKEFAHVLDLGKAIVFRKETEGRSLPEWVHEPYIVRKTEEHNKSQNPFALD